MAISISTIRTEIDSNLSQLESVDEATMLITGSVNTGLLDTFLRLEASRRGVRLAVKLGTYDNPTSDIRQYGTVGPKTSVLLVPFFDVITQEFESRAATLLSNEVTELKKQFRQRWTEVLSAIPDECPVLVAGLHAMYPNYPFGLSRKKEIIEQFNNLLRELVSGRPGTTFVDFASVIEESGRTNCVDIRMYHRAKNPYTILFASQIAPLILDALGIGLEPFKVLVLDCDNTLWGGILEEDGPLGIELDPNSSRGAMFRDVQRCVLELRDLGVLVCLVSKNDESDVLNVLDNHEHQILKRSDIISWRIGWSAKSESIQSLAQELNLGLSSFVFVDDSQFECAEVARLLPEVSVFRAPESADDYAQLLSALKIRLLQGRQEDKNDKTAQYKARRIIEDGRSSSSSEESFLESLELELEIRVDSLDDVTRLAEMFNKTNQFNLTTQRRTIGEIHALIKDQKKSVASVRVRDKFAAHGLTAALVTSVDDGRLIVTDWLMSCRILGRKIEFGLLSYLGSLAQQHDCRHVQIEHEESGRNGEAMRFLEDLETRLLARREGNQHILEASRLEACGPQWITIKT